MIPKVIHFCWFGKKRYPKIVKKCIKSWSKHCPDYEIKLWNEDNYDIKKNKWLETAYDQQKWAFVSDYARLDIIYNEGGIYLDTDVELISSLDDLLQYSCFLAIENVPPGFIATGLGFGAEKGHEAIKKMLEVYDTIEFNESNQKSILCPALNTKPFLEKGYIPAAKAIQKINNAIILPSDYFDPKDGAHTELHLTENSHGIHWGTRSWESGWTLWKAKIRTIIGAEATRLIKKLYKREYKEA